MASFPALDGTHSVAQHSSHSLGNFDTGCRRAYFNPFSLTTRKEALVHIIAKPNRKEKAGECARKDGKRK